jgi:hypothetical protein
MALNQKADWDRMYQELSGKITDAVNTTKQGNGLPLPAQLALVCMLKETVRLCKAGLDGSAPDKRDLWKGKIKAAFALAMKEVELGRELTKEEVMTVGGGEFDATEVKEKEEDPLMKKAERELAGTKLVH